MARMVSPFAIVEHKRYAKSGKPRRIVDASVSGLAGGIWGGLAGVGVGLTGTSKFIIRRLYESGKFNIHPDDLGFIKSKPGLAEIFAKTLLKAKKIPKEGLRTGEDIIKKIIATGGKRGGIAGIIGGAAAAGGLSYALYPGKKRRSKKFIEDIAAGKKGTTWQQENVREWMEKHKNAL